MVERRGPSLFRRHQGPLPKVWDMRTDAQKPRIVLGFRNHQDRHAARAIERAYLAAQPQSVEILTPERNDEAL